MQTTDAVRVRTDAGHVKGAQARALAAQDVADLQK